MKEVSAAPKITNVKAAILGFQHLLAMYSGDVLVPLLIGAALHFSQEQLTYLVSIDIFMCTIKTYTTNRNRASRRAWLCRSSRQSVDSNR